jgi:ssDNA-binding Zn-finger/Zn-ribbon topoisomerase 1
MKKNTERTANPTQDLTKSIGKTFSNKPKETVKTMDLEDKIELQRKEAYIKPKTRDLLRKLLQAGDKEEIIPVYTPGVGFVYPLSCGDPNEGGQDQITRNCLDDLADLDILNRNFFDSISTCPNCESTLITFHNRCPKCKSHNVVKTSLTEHIPCGYIDQKDKYNDDRCPKCGEMLVEGQYRNMGRWYVCDECSERFENPEFDLVCRNCSTHFSIKEAHILEIPKFSLNLTRKKEIRQNVASLEDIRALLTELGFDIAIPGLTTGQKSGMQHHFSLIAKKQVSGQETVIALDHSVSESEVSTSPLILYLYKISEVKVDIPIFIAMPQLNETAKKIAQGHNILLIEGSTAEKEVIDVVRKEIQDRINQKIGNVPNVQVEKKSEKKSDSGSFFNKLSLKKKQ